MLLTIGTTHQPATDLGYLLHKNPTPAQRFELSFSHAHVFYPASLERCAAPLLLDVDLAGLVRVQRATADESGRRAHYINDRPYVACRS